MRKRKVWFAVSGILVVLTMALMLPTSAVAASKYKELYKFTGDADGVFPNGHLILDEGGNIYGTTRFGGPFTGCYFGSGCGTVFKLTPNSDGSWTKSMIYGFTGGADGGNPYAGLIFDTSGSLYGTTYAGGTVPCEVQNDAGCGTVFELTPNPDGSWTESVLHDFTGFELRPVARLTFDLAGYLYGTTSTVFGTVFRLTPDGRWSERVLHSFTGGVDGGIPSDVTLDTVGNVYGTTNLGGDQSCNGGVGCGTVFKLVPKLNGEWKEHVLHKFKRGAFPDAGVIFDPSGNLYGTTSLGGSGNCANGGCGVVFMMTRNSRGIWQYHVIHKFMAKPAGGPGDLVLDAAGNLYGTTRGGNRAVVFKLAPNSDGSWTYRALHVFDGKPVRVPVSGLVLDEAGNLYGTADCLGSCAVIFRITP